MSDYKQIIKAMAIAVVISLAGIAVLSWQYYKLEEKQLPALEEKIEKNSAQNVLERFLETKADSLLTERAMEQKKQKDLFMMEGSNGYEILRFDKPSEGEYRFFVEIGDYMHVISLIKILDNYYIDSVEIAG